MTDNLKDRKDLIMFGGNLIPQDYFIHNLTLRLSAEHQFLDAVRNLLNENIIIPLVKNEEYGIRSPGKRGFRVYDYRLLNVEQIKTFFQMTNINTNRVVVPYHSPSLYIASTIEGGGIPDTVQEFETYDKLINITYLVDDDSLYKFLHGDEYFEEENIAKKIVKECSISELLFAVNKKLNKEEENK